MSEGKCKTCRFLVKKPCRADGRAITPVLPADDFWFACHYDKWPWALRPHPNPIMIGKRHAEPGWCAANQNTLGGDDDWTEEMDCLVWESRT